jgi:hypothetical protein
VACFTAARHIAEAFHEIYLQDSSRNFLHGISISELIRCCWNARKALEMRLASALAMRRRNHEWQESKARSFAN